MKHKLLLLLAYLLICGITQAQETGTQIKSDQPEITLTSNDLESLKPNINSSNQLNQMLLESIKDYIEWSNALVERTNLDPIRLICTDGLPADFPYDSLSIDYFSRKWLEGNSASVKRELKHFTNAIRIWYTLKNDVVDISIQDIRIRRPRKCKAEIEVSPECKHYRYNFSCETSEWRLIKD